MPAGHLLSEPALLDHIPKLLEALADALDARRDVRSALADLPDLHALDRLEEGYDVATAALELAALREVILEHWIAHAPSGTLIGAVGPHRRRVRR